LLDNAVLELEIVFMTLRNRALWSKENQNPGIIKISQWLNKESSIMKDTGNKDIIMT